MFQDLQDEIQKEKGYPNCSKKISLEKFTEIRK